MLKEITNAELRKAFITEVTNNLNTINDSDLTDYEFKLGYAVLSFLIDKYRLEKDALELISFYKENSSILKH